MTTYISILRGINVSGQKLIKMDTLKKMYEKLNFEKIQTYVQSGNVVFSANNDCPRGYGKTKLNNNFLENKVKATTRSW